MQQKEQKGNENGNSNDRDESGNNNNWYQNRFRKSSPYYRLNPVARIKQNTISDTVFNV